MPKEIFNRDYDFLPREDLLTFEEIARLVRVVAGLGVHKVRITGGEPLLRRDLSDLVAMIRSVPGIDDVTLTTNGTLLARKAEALAAAGLDRVSVSLDSVDDAVFMSMNDVDFPVQPVLDGIAAAADAGLTPVKVNAVIKRGVNDDAVLPMAEYFRGTGHIVRFIEYTRRRDPRRHRRCASARVGGGRLPGRGRSALSLPRRPGRDWRHRFGDGAVLRGMHPGQGLCRGQAVHLPLRHPGPRPAGLAA
jgi:molybdenum cofactor biosynthesis enzyme MoaA